MDKPVDPENGANKGNVERWLLEIEAIQWDSIRTLTVASLDEYAKLPRRQWLLNWPAQVIFRCCGAGRARICALRLPSRPLNPSIPVPTPPQVILGVSCVYWTQEVTAALKANGGQALADCNAKVLPPFAPSHTPTSPLTHHCPFKARRPTARNR